MRLAKEHIINGEKNKSVPRAGGLPLIGQSLQARNNPLGLLTQLVGQHADMVTVRLGLKDFCLVQSPQAARHILQENARNYYKPGAARLMKKVLGNGLATSNGELWLHQRRLMQPAFHKQHLTYFFHLIGHEVSHLAAKWKTENDGATVNITKSFLHLTLNNICKAMFGAGIENQTAEIEGLLGTMLTHSSKNLKALLKMPLWMPTPGNLRFKKAEARFENILYRVIDQRKKNGNVSQRNDLLQMLLAATENNGGGGMSAQQLRDEITTIFLAGHETTAQTLSWVFYHLALNQNIQGKVRQEVSSVEWNGIGPECLQSFTYTRAVIEEALRIYPPVWIMARKAAANDCVAGFSVPAGTTLLINVYGMHHHPSHWVAPGDFQPERWLNGTKENLPSYLYLPFGGGPRLCIGHHFAMMVMQTVVAKLVQAFHFTLPVGAAPIVDANLTLRAKEGIHLHIHQNQKHAKEYHT